MMLDLRNLVSAYGNILALQGVSLHVKPSEIVTILGSNGAGKTTLLMAIAGLVPPRQGEILWEGRPIQQLTPDQIKALLRPGIGEQIVLAQLQLVHTPCSRQSLARFYVSVAQLQAEYPPAGAHDRGKIEGGKAWPCSKIKHPLPCPQTCSMPGGAGRGLPELVLKSKPLQLVGVGAQQIAGVGHGRLGTAGQSSGKSRPASSSASTS